MRWMTETDKAMHTTSSLLQDLKHIFSNTHTV